MGLINDCADRWMVDKYENFCDDDDFDYNYDRCYECTGYGDDYYYDDDGDMVSACGNCIHNNDGDDYDYDV